MVTYLRRRERRRQTLPQRLPPRGQLRARRRSWPSAPLRCVSPTRAIKSTQNTHSIFINGNPTGIQSHPERLACSINPDQSIAINLNQEQSRAIKSASPARSIQTNPLQSTSSKSNQEQSRAPRLLDQSRPIHFNQPQSRAIKSNQECLTCSSLGSLVIGLLHKQSRAIKSNQEQSRVPHLLELGLLSHRVVTQVDRLRSGLRGVAAPGLTPEPLLGQGVDGHLMRDTIRRNDSEAIGGHPRQS